MFQKLRQRLRDGVKSFGQLKATEVEQVFLVSENLIVDGRVPVVSLDVKRRANQSRIARKLFLNRTVGRLDVALELVLQRFDAFCQRQVAILFDARVPTGFRRCAHDVCGAKQRD